MIVMLLLSPPLVRGGCTLASCRRLGCAVHVPTSTLYHRRGCESPQLNDAWLWLWTYHVHAFTSCYMQACMPVFLY